VRLSFHHSEQYLQEKWFAMVVMFTKLINIVSVLYVSNLFIDLRFKSCCAFIISRNRANSHSRHANSVSPNIKHLGHGRNVNSYLQLEMSPDEGKSVESILSESTAPPTAEDEKPNREYSIQILNAIRELKREDWNGLLDENSR
jgi:hypothetical protein